MKEFYAAEVTLYPSDYLDILTFALLRGVYYPEQWKKLRPHDLRATVGIHDNLKELHKGGPFTGYLGNDLNYRVPESKQ